MKAEEMHGGTWNNPAASSWSLSLTGLPRCQHAAFSRERNLFDALVLVPRQVVIHRNHVTLLEDDFCCVCSYVCVYVYVCVLKSVCALDVHMWQKTFKWEIHASPLTSFHLNSLSHAISGLTSSVDFLKKKKKTPNDTGQSLWADNQTDKKAHSPGCSLAEPATQETRDHLSLFLKPHQTPQGKHPVCFLFGGK